MEAASLLAGRTDALMLAMVLLCGLVAAVLCALVVIFAVRYRRGARVDRTRARELRGIEVGWALAPLLVFFGIYAWAARDFMTLYDPPPNALPVSVVAKQWMWKLQHRNGRREINELHVPLGEPVVVTMTSEDVIHSFFIPAFRIKQDVLPGRYTRLWFVASTIGEFPLFCSEYCGSEHSSMIGRVVVMSAADYGRWLSSGPAQPSMAQYGYALARQLGCSGCHDARSTIHAPALEGLYGRPVHLQDGRTTVADANYLRDSILLPAKEVVAGFAPVMPSYAGQVSEEDLQALIAWIESTGAKDPA
ncbi:MAG TPA: cytochrome c oxidase subunit II [Burkholderiaceae bacterium]|nr:cytochrome c oxidase subunit II [Burkholderiaceae bacterium]